jgi:hypothetical protein
MSTHRLVALKAHTPPPYEPSSQDDDCTPAMPFSLPRRAYELVRDRLLFQTTTNIHQKTSDDAPQPTNTAQIFTVQAETHVIPLQKPQPLDVSVTRISPSREASQTARLAENGFGDKQAAWGWPGIGTWPEDSKPSRESDPAVQSKGHEAQ